MAIEALNTDATGSAMSPVHTGCLVRHSGGFSQYYRTGELHVNLIGNRSDYLSGVNNVLVRIERGSDFAMNEKSWSETFSIDAANTPFITLIFRYIHKEGGRGDSFQHDFWDWKLEKI